MCDPRGLEGGRLYPEPLGAPSADEGFVGMSVITSNRAPHEARHRAVLVVV